MVECGIFHKHQIQQIIYTPWWPKYKTHSDSQTSDSTNYLHTQINAYLLKAKVNFLHPSFTLFYPKMLSFSSIFPKLLLLFFLLLCFSPFSANALLLLFINSLSPPTDFRFLFLSLPCANPFHSPILSIPSLSRGE